MPHLSPDSILLVIVTAVFTAAAAVCDMRWRRIPNTMTVPVFALGLIYQGFHGWSGLADAGSGFLLGFGMLFVLWMIGGGGGGDVKLMGALSVWLGFEMTLAVVIVSTALVVVITGGSMMWRGLTGRYSKLTREHPAEDEQPAKRRRNTDKTAAKNTERRVTAYAVPVALATWMVLIWKLPDLP